MSGTLSRSRSNASAMLVRGHAMATGRPARRARAMNALAVATVITNDVAPSPMMPMPPRSAAVPRRVVAAAPTSERRAGVPMCSCAI